MFELVECEFQQWMRFKKRFGAQRKSYGRFPREFLMDKLYYHSSD